MIAEMILSACAAASEFLALENVWLGIARMEMQRVGQSEVFTGTGTVLSACAVVSGFSVLANVQLGIVGMETEWEEMVMCLVVAVHSGMSAEMLMVVEGASANTVMLLVSGEA